MQKIVVGFDGSPDGAAAVRWARSVALAAPGREIHLLEAVALPPIPPESWLVSAGKLVEEMEATARRRLEEAAAEFAGAGIAVETHLRRWQPAHALLELAAEVGAGLVVLGRRGRSARRALLGSVSGEVSREALVPVAIVRGDAGHSPARKVLVALDGSAASRNAARAAADAFPQATLVAATIRHGHERLGEAEVARELADAGVEAARHELRTAEGNPAEELLALARNEEVDLVAAGRRGHGPLHELLVGNVAEKLLQLAPCPLLLAH
jgi:nucleotide-binding universal stress UspA family protein